MKAKIRIRPLIYLLLVSIVSTEIGLRLYGLGNWITYEENLFYEYRLTPNQNITRFYNIITTNSYGMRASNEPKSTSKKILKFGDSVLNGGSKIDDNEAVNILLQESLNKDSTFVELFNISAGSWGPDNAFAFLQHAIDFKFDAIVLVFSGHDYRDNMHHNSVVGIHPSWPNNQPVFAIEDVWIKVLRGKVFKLIGWDSGSANHLKGHDNTMMNPGWKNFFEYTENNSIPFLVYLHPEKKELMSQEWSEESLKLISWLKSHKIKYVDGIDKGYLENSYVDNIHLNANGHKALYNNLLPEMDQLCKAL